MTKDKADNRTEEIIINSVSDYLTVLNKIKTNCNTSDKTFFFRGTANREWKNIPSIYRPNENFIQNEKEIYYEMIARCPQYFKHCTTTLEHLVMMQHYNAPTRLLDITENPLVALFFSCSNHIETEISKSTFKETKTPIDGRVDIFNVPNGGIKQYNSDTAAMLANLAKIDNEFNIDYLKFNQAMEIYEDADNYKNYNQILSRDSNRVPYSRFTFFKRAIEVLTHEIMILNELNHILQHAQDVPYLQKIRPQVAENLNLIQEIIKELDIQEEIYNKDIRFEYNSKDITNRTINILKTKTRLFKQCSDTQNILFDRYICFIREEKSYFDPSIIDLKHLESVICIRPKQDNPHIIRQNGAFLLFGIKENSGNKLECASIPDGYIAKTETTKDAVCIIPADKKADILKELQSLSITNGHLFTDIDKVAIDVKSKYSNN